MMWNILEFVWVTGFPERIRKCYCLSDETARRLKKHAEAGERCIFVNPHLGSWEASGVSAPFFADLNMIAIAKPVHNPYLNALLNSGSREQTKGLKVVFSRGAVRAALTALRNGQSIGTLVDQNTRVRDGGEFVDFFGLPVPSSTAPAMLKRYCDAHDIPVVIIFGTSVRLADGRNTALTEYLSKPFDDYADDREVLQELLQISERYIRQYPEQYLWFYKRFQHIKPDTPPEIRKRYPSYARIPTPHFFSKAKRK
jgi:KDO2-lipid IV(A) lauroyltransferase